MKKKTTNKGFRILIAIILAIIFICVEMWLFPALYNTEEDIWVILAFISIPIVIYVAFISIRAILKPIEIIWKN